MKRPDSDRANLETVRKARQHMIEIRDLNFSYGDDDFRLCIPELLIEAGSTVSLVGPSGSGKTTFLNLVAGIIAPISGSIRTLGSELSEVGDAGRREFRLARLGLIFQEFELLGYLSVIDNILLPYRIGRALTRTAETIERANQLAEDVGLDDKLTRPASQLSQGEKQRVAVCRALVHEPEILLADEPTGNLDPANKGRVLDILFEYAKEHSSTLLTVTHDMGLVDRFDRSIDFKQFHAEGVAAEENSAS